MSDQRADQRLSQISTRWSLIFKAHHDVDSEKMQAQFDLSQRYCGAIYNYLLAVIKDVNVVDELCQEFAFRLVRGDFKRARPQQGRFRDYVKSSLFHLVADYRRREQSQPKPLPFDSAAFAQSESGVGNPEEEFIQRWKDELLDRTWEALANIDQQTGRHSFTVLRIRAEQPELSSEQLAEEVSRRLGRVLNAVAVRQLLHRAREKFADLLIEEVGRSLQTTDPQRVEEELADLRLVSYCKPALDRRKVR